MSRANENKTHGKNTNKIHIWRSAKNYGFIPIWLESSHEGGDGGRRQRPSSESSSKSQSGGAPKSMESYEKGLGRDFEGMGWDGMGLLRVETVPQGKSDDEETSILARKKCFFRLTIKIG